MKNVLTTRLVVMATVCLVFAAAQAASNLLSEQDTEFVGKAAQGGLAEVALGGLAADRARNDMVRDFGSRMVKDHGDANAKLLELAQAKGYEPPKALSKEHQAELDRLKAIDAEAFDRAYVEAMVKDHRKDVAEFEKQAKEADDPDLRRYAEQTLPTLQSHLDAILDIEESL